MGQSYLSELSLSRWITLESSNFENVLFCSSTGCSASNALTSSISSSVSTSSSILVWGTSRYTCRKNHILLKHLQLSFFQRLWSLLSSPTLGLLSPLLQLPKEQKMAEVCAINYSVCWKPLPIKTSLCFIRTRMWVAFGSIWGPPAVSYLYTFSDLINLYQKY